MFAATFRARVTRRFSREKNLAVVHVGDSGLLFTPLINANEIKFASGNCIKTEREEEHEQHKTIRGVCVQFVRRSNPIPCVELSSLHSITTRKWRTRNGVMVRGGRFPVADDRRIPEDAKWSTRGTALSLSKDTHGPWKRVGWTRYVERPFICATRDIPRPPSSLSCFFQRCRSAECDAKDDCHLR